MICSRNGVEPDSDRYLAGYLRQDMTIDHFDLYALLKSAGQIETVLDLAAHSQF